MNQFTQYRLLVNHNKYTFQYIIHNKYWKIKSNTGFLTGCSVIVSSLLTLYALAQLIYHRPCWCHWLPESSLYTSFVPPRRHERSQLLDKTAKTPVLILVIIKYGQIFASLEEGQISVFMQEQTAQGKELQQCITAVLFTKLLQSPNCWANFLFVSDFIKMC